MSEIAYGYCDGGVAGRNPSKVGGSWAYYVLDSGNREVGFKSGVVRPHEFGIDVITNNFTELYAAIELLSAMPDDWKGTIFTDSKCTMLRIKQTKKQAKLNGIPECMRISLQENKERLGQYSVELLDGHPTYEQLMKGIGKRGNPVSRWNVRCDKECQRLSRSLLRKSQCLKPS